MAKTTTRWGLPYPELTDGADVPLHVSNLAKALDAVAMDEQGTLASRPTSSVGTPGKKGRYYFATDKGVLYRDNGTGWDVVGGDEQGTLASRPAAATPGRYYFATDQAILYRDTGTGWVAVNPVQVYAPKIIAGEEQRTANTFATLATADEVKNVIVPTNAKVLVSYHAHVRSGTPSVERLGLFINGTQAKAANGVPLETAPASAEPGYNIMVTNGTGFTTIGSATNVTDDPATGQVLSSAPIELFLNAGTYTFDVRYKSGTGTLFAKERRLYVEVHAPSA